MEKWLRLILSIFCISWCQKTSKRSPEGESWDIRLHKFGPNWAQNALSQKEKFSGKLTNNTLTKFSIPSLGRISTYPWTLFGKNVNFPFAPQKDFWKKMIKVKLPFSTYSRSRNIRLKNFEANWTQIYHMPRKVFFDVGRLFYH